MAEPTSTAAAITLTAGAITITGSILGLEYQLLLVGMFGGLIALSFFPQSTRWRMASSVATSALLAGYATPVLAAISINKLEALGGIASQPLQLLLALLIGISAQFLIPAGMGWLRKFTRQDGQRPGGQS